MILVSAGLSNDVIASQLFLSSHTAKSQVDRAMTKLVGRDGVQLVVIAWREDWSSHAAEPVAWSPGQGPSPGGGSGRLTGLSTSFRVSPLDCYMVLSRAMPWKVFP